MSTNTQSINENGNSPIIPEFSVSENAAKRVLELIKDETEAEFLRISINGGGCSGFQYNFDFTKGIKDDDHKFERDGAVVVIDEMSLAFVKGSELDYVETLGSAGFEIKNPNATANCGCGKSFSV